MTAPSTKANFAPDASACCRSTSIRRRISGWVIAVNVRVPSGVAKARSAKRCLFSTPSPSRISAPKWSCSSGKQDDPGSSTSRAIWSASIQGYPCSAKKFVALDLPHPERPVIPMIFTVSPPGTPRPESGGCKRPSRHPPVPGNVHRRSARRGGQGPATR